jgi:DNA-binding transcriptional LysR family regulator
MPGLQLELVARDQLGDIVGEGFDLAIRLGEPRASTLIARKFWDTLILTVAAPVQMAGDSDRGQRKQIRPKLLPRWSSGKT